MSKIFSPIKMNIQLLANDTTDTDETTEEKIVKLQEQLLKMNEMIEENQKLKTLNDTLFTKNQEYFLKITGNGTQDKEEVNEYEEYVGKEFYANLSNKEKKQLEQILEGEDE